MAVGFEPAPLSMLSSVLQFDVCGGHRKIAIDPKKSIFGLKLTRFVLVPLIYDEFCKCPRQNFFYYYIDCVRQVSGQIA